MSTLVLVMYYSVYAIATFARRMYCQTRQASIASHSAFVSIRRNPVHGGMNLAVSGYLQEPKYVRSDQRPKSPLM